MVGSLTAAIFVDILNLANATIQLNLTDAGDAADCVCHFTIIATAQIFGTSNYLRNGWGYEIHIWLEHLQGPSEQMPI